ncbi:hypothetical protein CQR51_0392 [Bifidobacterium pseudolongum subsp. globosum]|uniref:hypothetical protein n=1 Tax=Bifidobacterium pseudolongum TaxID=1694 RepID=UPI000C7025E6|nr:hypothetical protein [Bifidobacterium pseudolongum]PKV06902.1 hypothetical protein CQR51_0392 [Bifidobacterium pseudolongum subsp. globosum]RYQ57585.1 hypothetical protein PG1565B_0464 [Bifidobacterium pseudolongum subsp. globosum]RYQ61054.1 hypothetical protein PG1546B_0463 [Bifidobacterium pseudolongum subsp. globosum]
MIEQKKAPRRVNAEGQTNVINSTAPAADVYPSHPANLLPAVAEHLLVAAFGVSWAAASAEAVKTAQGLALTVAVVRGVVSRKPVPAWRVARLAGGEGAMLSVYARLAGDMAVTVADNVGVARECRDLNFPHADEALVPQNTAPLPHTIEFDEIALCLHLEEFAEHARHHEYDEARIVELADTITPPFPFRPWKKVAAELGVVA